MRKKSFWALSLLLLLTLGISGFAWGRSVQSAVPNPDFQGNAPHFLYAIYGGGRGDPGADLKRPLALTVTPDGRIMVADTGNRQIRVFNFKGKELLKFGQGKLNYPFNLTYWDQKVYVADPNLMKIFVFDEQGQELPPLLEKKRLQLASGELGDVIRPTAIQFGPDGNAYLTDAGNQCVVVLDANGKILRSYGSAGSEDGRFQYPNALWLSDRGELFVSDSNNGRIQIFDIRGNYLSKIDGTQGELGQLSLPRGLAVSKDGTIIVVDVFLHSVRAFDRSGKEVWALGGMGTGNGQFQFPNGLYLDAQGRIYVSDRENNRVQVFSAS